MTGAVLLGCSHAPNEVDGKAVSFDRAVAYASSFSLDGLAESHYLIEIGACAQCLLPSGVLPPCDAGANSAQVTILGFGQTVGTYSTGSDSGVSFGASVPSTSDTVGADQLYGTGSVTFTHSDSREIDGTVSATFAPPSPTPPSLADQPRLDGGVTGGQIQGSFRAVVCHLSPDGGVDGG